MRLRSLVAGAVFGALSVSSLSPQASAAARVQALGAADASTTSTFHVYLPLTHTAALEQLLRDQTDASSPSYHRWLTPAQFKQQFGPNPADFGRARAILQSAGLTVVAEKTQSLEVRGSVGAIEGLFATQLERVKTQKGRIKLAAANGGRLRIPQALAAMGAVVPEFAPHLASHVHSHVARAPAASGTTLSPNGSAVPQDRLANDFAFFYANDLNEAYQLPAFNAHLTPLHSHHPAQIAGVGSTIGIVISSIINPGDLAKSFNSVVSAGGVSDVQNFNGNSNLPAPTVTVHPVGAGSGAFNPDTADAAEASLDTQMSLGTAPGAKEILYDMEDLTDEAIVAAYTQVDEENVVDVVSSSFGECELDFTAAYNGGTDFTGILKTFHALFQQGNAQGITFLASSGDNGAVPCVSKQFANNPMDGTSFVLGVENPASDPNVTAVGGTNLQTSGTPTPDDVTYVSENADFDPRVPAVFQDSAGNLFSVDNNTWGSGGGFSSVFGKPVYQFLVNTGSNKHRAVPDISLMMGGCPGDADIAAQDCTVLPRSATIVWIGGVPNLLIGTSSSSPEMAGVLALAVELSGGRLGNVNPLIYALSTIQTLAGGTHAPQALQYFHRNVAGNNNGFTVKPGQAYSEVLGNGTIDVKNFLGVPFAPAAGAPSTPSNP